jgi:hypothetical protein
VALRVALDGAVRPCHYLAIPPSLPAVGKLGSSGCAANARVVVEKPRRVERRRSTALQQVVDERSICIDHFLGQEAVQNPLYFASRTYHRAAWNRTHGEHVQIIMAEKLASRVVAGTKNSVRCGTSCRTTCRRASDPDGAACRHRSRRARRKMKVLCHPASRPPRYVRGQYGYRSEDG